MGYGGPKRILDSRPELTALFLDVINNYTAGDPMRDDIKWTNLSVSDIIELFGTKGIVVSAYIVKQLLSANNFVKRAAKKEESIDVVEDRNAQFENIASIRSDFESAGEVIISMDIKKELIGNFYRPGQVYCAEAQRVLDRNFPSSSTGMSIPHGIFDIKRNEAYVTIGTSKDTSEFNCNCIQLWWNDYGKKNYPNATKILILSDGGGSNSSRHYIFKQELQDLSNETGMIIRMAHYPPYTSKYNPIEHKVFCHITRACQGVIFKNIEIVNELIGRSKTKTGLKVYSRIVTTIYETGKKIRDDFKEKMTIKFDDYLGKWNYVAIPDAAI